METFARKKCVQSNQWDELLANVLYLLFVFVKKNTFCVVGFVALIQNEINGDTRPFSVNELINFTFPINSIALF